MYGYSMHSLLKNSFNYVTNFVHIWIICVEYKIHLNLKGCDMFNDNLWRFWTGLDGEYCLSTILDGFESKLIHWIGIELILILELYRFGVN